MSQEMSQVHDNPLRDLNNARNLPKDTPETDAKASPHIGFFSCATVPAEFARRLERERDEAKEIIRKASVKFFEDGPDGQIAVKMFEILGSLEKEAR
jgi:hypothetical protein